MQSLNYKPVELASELTPYALRRLSYASFVVPEAKLVYVETPKSACSSFKHTVASLAGFNCTETFSSDMAAKTRALAIHDRPLVDVLSLSDLSENQLRKTVEDDSYLRVCVVRNPYLRLASAWADRLLSHSLSPNAKIIGAYGFPEYKADILYLKYKFSEFVNCLYENEYPRFSNHHWRLMKNLLLPDIVNYNLILKVEEMGSSLPRVIDHVESNGLVWPGLPRINETVLKLGACLYSSSSRKKVSEMYRSDFLEFDYSMDLDLSAGVDIALPDEHQVRAIQERNQRIFFLSLKTRNKL